MFGRLRLATPARNIIVEIRAELSPTAYALYVFAARIQYKSPVAAVKAELTASAYPSR
jgi:hypothetical protein